MYTLLFLYLKNRLGFKRSSLFFKRACSKIVRSHAVCTCGATYSDKLYVHSLPKQARFQTVQFIFLLGMFKHWKKSRCMHLWSAIQWQNYMYICILFQSYNLKIDQVSNSLAYFLTGHVQTLEEVMSHALVEQHTVRNCMYTLPFFYLKNIRFQTVQLIFQLGMFKHQSSIQ